MFQIGLLMIAAALFFPGIQALRGKEDPEKRQTSKGVAIAMIVVAILVAAFAIVVLPNETFRRLMF